MRVTYLFSIVSAVFITAVMLLGIFHLGSSAAPTAVFTVNSTADATDAVPGNGICETAPGNGICTLRAAIRESNALAGADEIILPAGTYLLTIPGVNENNAATGDLDITGPLTISGAGAATTIIDANGLDRVLDIQAQGSLSLQGVTVRGGFVTGGSGGGINMLNGNLTVTDSVVTQNSSNAGGGIAQLGSSPQIVINNSTINANTSVNGPGGGLFINAANLQITDSVISGNAANDGGGLVFYFGSLTMTDSVVEGNTAVTIGGGIFNGGSGLVISSTIQNNTSNGSNANNPGGGGITNAGTLTVRNSEVISNHAPNYGGGGLINAGTLMLENTAVTHNNALYGGGLYNFDAAGAVVGTDLLLAENNAWAGGGIFGRGGTFTFTNSLVDGNTAIGLGGGGLVFTGTAGVVISSTVQNNTANGSTPGWSGGGGFFNLGTLTIADSQVVSNHAPNQSGGGLLNRQMLLMENTRLAHNNARYGGGLYNYEVAASIVGTDLTFDQNIALRGGAIESLTGTLTLNNSTISHNIATYDAGGVFVARGGGSFTNVTISGNQAGGDGGGIYVYEQDFAILNSTIVNNTAQGGAIYIFDPQSVLTLTNTIVANNQWSNCAGFPPLSGGHNLDSGITCGLIAPGDLSNTNPVLGPLQDNGGPTETHTFTGPSPAIDGADNASCPATDQRGILRPQGPSCDIGAVEFILPDPPTPTPTPDTPTPTPETPTPTPDTPTPTPDTPTPTPDTPTPTPDTPTPTPDTPTPTPDTPTPTPDTPTPTPDTPTPTPETPTPTVEPPRFTVYLPMISK